jgi:hypothetical protein
MLEKFRFSNGQDLAALDSTGVISTNIWDIEENAVTDGQLTGWINGRILATTNTGGDEGLEIEVRTSDATNGGSPRYLGGIKLLQAEIVAGKRFSIGINKAALLKYIMIWYKAVNTSLDNATTVDVDFEMQQQSELNIQKKPS